MVTFCEQKKLKKFILGFKVFCCPDLEKFLHEVVAKVVHGICVIQNEQNRIIQ